MGQKVVILGAGVSGLGIGWKLARDGFDVTVLEKENHIGGLSATFHHQGFSYDYGPHNFHTHMPHVQDFVFDELGVKMEPKHLKASKIFFRKKLVDYPIKGLQALTTLDPLTAFLSASDFALTRLKLRLFAYEERSFEDWIVHRYGRGLYNIYFGPYAEKVWGLPGSKIDQVVASKKVPTASLTELLIRAIFRTEAKREHTEDLETVDSYYPRQGIGALAHKLADGIIEADGRVQLNAEPVRINTQDNEAVSLDYLFHDRPASETVDYLINTIPLDKFTGLLGGPNKRSDLKYRSMVLLYMVVDHPQILDVPWMYFNDPGDRDLIFNRVYEVGNFSREMGMTGKSALCFEITCDLDDELWKAETKDLFTICCRYMERNKFFKQDEVDDFFAKRLEVVYPVFEVGYSEHLAEHLALVKSFSNVTTIGRQGAFTYTNIDQCLAMALRLYDYIKANSKKGKKVQLGPFLDELINEFG